MKTIHTSYNNFKWILPENDVLTIPMVYSESSKHSDSESSESIPDSKLEPKPKPKSHEEHLLKFIDAYVNEGDTVLDIGACFGYHTLPLALKVKGKNINDLNSEKSTNKGKVFAFEPQIDMFSLLQTNIEQNQLDDVVKLFNVALGNTVQSVCMYNAYKDDITNYGDSFISWTYKDTNISAIDDYNVQGYIGKGQDILSLNKQIVQCTRLDDLLRYYITCPSDEHIRFMKIDVQGFERMVLLGAKQIIETNRPLMVIEFEDDCMRFHGYTSKELIEYIHSIGYIIMLLDAEYACDHICIPKEQYFSFYQQFKTNIHSYTEYNPINHSSEYGVSHKLVL